MTSLDESWWAQILGGPECDLHVTSSTEQYVVLPRASEPRVVVDNGDPQALRDAVTRFVENRIGSAAAPIAGGASAFLSRRRPTWGVSSAGLTLREHLSDLLGREVRLSIAVGPSRPNRKPVVRCYADSQLAAVAKMGPDPHTAEMVKNEGHWLRRLQDEPLDGILTPELLHQGSFGTSELVLMAPLNLSSEAPMLLEDVPMRATTQFAERFATTDSLLVSPWWEALQGRLQVTGLERFAEVADKLVEAGDIDELAVSGWHGDWSPWNMTRMDDGTLGLWDWERAGTGVPTGLDLLHLHYQYGDGLEGATPTLRAIDVSSDHQRLLELIYLLELAARHAEAGVLGSERQTGVEQTLTRLAGPRNGIS